MESSLSSMIKLPSSLLETERITIENDDDYDEPSSWTFYFEDFKYKDELKTCDLSSGDCKTPSQVSSVAASLGKKKSLRKSSCRNLSFKRQKTDGFFADSYDDDLEDTASSPLSSPKVSFLNQLDMIPMSGKETNNLNCPKEKENVCGQIHEKSVVLHVGDRDYSYTELKKRGLCLVPVSMLANIISSS